VSAGIPYALSATSYGLRAASLLANRSVAVLALVTATVGVNRTTTVVEAFGAREKTGYC